MGLVVTPQGCLSITDTGFGQGTGETAGLPCCYGTMYLWVDVSGVIIKTCDEVFFFGFLINRSRILGPVCVVTLLHARLVLLMRFSF